MHRGLARDIAKLRKTQAHTTDAVLVARGGATIRAHASILAMRSTSLCAMLSREKKGQHVDAAPSCGDSLDPDENEPDSSELLRVPLKSYDEAAVDWIVGYAYGEDLTGKRLPLKFLGQVSELQSRLRFRGLDSLMQNRFGMRPRADAAADSRDGSFFDIKAHGLTCDVTIIAGKGAAARSFRVNSAVLAARAGYFATLFSKRWIEARGKSFSPESPLTLEYPDVPHPIMKIMLDFAFSGEISLAGVTATAAATAADSGGGDAVDAEIRAGLACLHWGSYFSFEALLEATEWYLASSRFLRARNLPALWANCFKNDENTASNLSFLSIRGVLADQLTRYVEENLRVLIEPCLKLEVIREAKRRGTDGREQDLPHAAREEAALREAAAEFFAIPFGLIRRALVAGRAVVPTDSLKRAVRLWAREQCLVEQKGCQGTSSPCGNAAQGVGLEACIVGYVSKLYPPATLFNAENRRRLNAITALRNLRAMGPMRAAHLMRGVR